MISTALKSALAELRFSGDSLEENLRAAGMESPSEFLRSELGLEPEDVLSAPPDSEALRALPVEAVRALMAMPIKIESGKLKVAVLDPTDLKLQSDLRLISGRPIKPVLSDRKTIEKLIDQHYRTGNPSSGSKEGPSEPKTQRPSPFGGKGGNNGSKGEKDLDQNPIIRMVHDVIGDAIRMGSSDIHLEPFEREMQVRLRHDGMLRVHRTIHARSKAEVVSRIKVMAKLDIAERRRPQDGRIRVDGPSGPVDLRVSTLPTEHGEKVVLRILDKSSVPLELSALGLDPVSLGKLETALKQPYGMILMTGPTGAGKTTTLYASLNRIKSPEINLITVEDPIEYKLEGVTQTAVKPDIGYTFANALRTILRQDPNVILVGEIRDRETAEIAVRSAMTGHLVLSTLHANDAPGAVARLLDMGIEPFLLASALTFIGAQRLVRKVCPHCAEDVSSAGNAELPPDATLRKGKGCSFCGRTGYSGRVAVYEVMAVTEALRTGIIAKQDAAILRETAIKEGMTTLRQDGLRKAASGITTLEEVYRETA